MGDKEKSAEKDIIYIVYSCDVWKSYDSMRFVCATTDINVAYAAVGSKIAEGSMVYQGLSNKNEAFAAFKQDFQNGEVDLNSIDYGFVKIADNEKFGASEHCEYADAFRHLGGGATIAQEGDSDERQC